MSPLHNERALLLDEHTLAEFRNSDPDSDAMRRCAERGVPLADFECPHGWLTYMGEHCPECGEVGQ